MKNYVSAYTASTEKKAYSVGRVLGTLLANAGIIALIVVLAIKTHGTALWFFALAKPVLAIAIPVAILVLCGLVCGTCKLILKIMDKFDK